MSHLYVNSEESQAFDFEEHMGEVRSMFEAMEIENGEAGKGIKYAQFLELLKTKLLQTFEDDEFEDYCSKLDSSNTGRILFDDFHEMLVNCEEDTQEQAITERGSYQMTAEKLTEFRFVFENNKEPIPNATAKDDCQFQIDVKKIRQEL